MKLSIRYFGIALAASAFFVMSSSSAKAQHHFHGTMLPGGAWGAGPPPVNYSPQFRANVYSSAYRNPLGWGYPYIYQNLYSSAYSSAYGGYYYPSYSPTYSGGAKVPTSYFGSVYSKQFIPPVPQNAPALAVGDK